MPPKTTVLRCAKCKKIKARCDFTPWQRKRSRRHCKTCARPSPAPPVLGCTLCQQDKNPNAFSSHQRQRSTRRCRDCIRQGEQLCCQACGESLPRAACSLHQVAREARRCLHCVQTRLSLHLGSLTKQCGHCGAALFPDEPPSLCCNHGKYAV